MVGIERDAEKLYLRDVTVQCRQSRHLRRAGRAPGRPEVEHHHLASQLAEVYAVLAVADTKDRRGLADLAGVLPAVTAPHSENGRDHDEERTAGPLPGGRGKRRVVDGEAEWHCFL